MFGVKRIGIDLGTKNTIVYVPGKGLVINEPSVVVLDASDSKIVAIGKKAQTMLGKTPDSLIAMHPLKDGVIANYQVTQAMLKYFINKVMGRLLLIKPDLMIAVPAGVTSTERRAVIDAATSAGAKIAYIIKEPIAAALGAGVQISLASGNMIIDCGGGTSEVAVISLGDVVASSSVRVAGNKMDEAIANYIRKKHDLVIGEQTAEQIKINIGSAIKPQKNLKMEVSGSNAITNLPESIIVTSEETVVALKEVLKEIIATVKDVLRKTPPELTADIMDKGIIMTGGASQLRNFDNLMTKVTGVPCALAEEAHLAVARGTGIAVEHLDEFKRSVLWAK